MKKALMAVFLTVALCSIVVPIFPPSMETFNHGVNG